MRAQKPDGMHGPPCILASNALTLKQQFFVAVDTADLANFRPLPL